MPIKTYLEEFKRDAVALYENSPGTSIQKIANDLGINRMTLKNWIATAPDRLGPVTKVGAEGCGGDTQ